MLGDLQGCVAVPLVACGSPAGVAFVEMPRGQGPFDPATSALRMGLVASCFRIAHDAREMRRMREEHYEHLVRSETLAAPGWRTS